MGSRYIPGDWTPDQPHPDPMRERWAQLVSAGESQAAAYGIARGKLVSVESQKVSGYRLSKEPACASRVAHLRQEREVGVDALEPLNAATAAEAMAETVHVLDEALTIATRLAVSLNDMAKLRAALAAAAARAFRLRESTPGAALAAATAGEPSPLIGIEPMPGCSCECAGEA